MVDEVIQHEDRYYILAGSTPADSRMLVLKHGETFGVFNQFGDIDNRSQTAQGLFAEGMRYLSRMRIRLDGARPLLLGSKVTDDNTRIIIDLTNPDLIESGEMLMSRGSLHVCRLIYLWDASYNEKLTITNYANRQVDVEVSLSFDCDFADIFEVRGTQRARRGEMLESHVTENVVVRGYQGLDGVTRRTRIECEPTPLSMTDHEIRMDASIQPREQSAFYVTVRCEPLSAARSGSFKENAIRLDEQVNRDQSAYCEFESSSRPLEQWLCRSLADIRTLISPTPTGPYPYAGVPWFSTPFGRDGIITALQLLWVNPDVARGVLAYLAATQAHEHDPARDAEPGKILHEHRTDEMAVTGEVPFGRYYGSVDATPLFVILAGAYFAATADLPFIQSLWPHIERALLWIDESGDMDGDGFVEYQTRASDGLGNQGWKDSHDAIFHSNGNLAVSPIALCEVQGYTYQAKLQASALARAQGNSAQSDELARQATDLRERFNQAFWLPDLGTYALALDGEKRACAVKTSNAGHCLFSGIADETQARSIRDLLLSREMFSGWAVQTVAADEARFNPMSYHNGSVWPHDNAIIAAGLARYGFQESALRMLRNWFDASMALELHRLPELFCGFRRRRGKGPTLYPVACSPQAWAAGSVFMMLAACLGLSIDGVGRRIHLHRPRMPRSVNELRIRNLRIGPVHGGTIDLLFHRERRDVGVLVLRKDGPIDVVVTK